MNSPSLMPTIVEPFSGGLPAYPVEADFRELPLRDLRSRLRVFVKYKRLAALCSIAVFSVVAAAVWLTPNGYTASARVLVARQSPIQLRLEDNVLRLGEGGDTNARDNFNPTQVAALESRDLAERVIREKRLASNVAFLQPATIAERLTPFSATATAAPAKAANDDDNPPPVDARLIDRYVNKFLNVQSVRGTDLIEVDFTTPDPALSAFLVQAHTEAYIAANIEARSNTRETATSFLATQVRESRKRVEAAESALRAFAVEHPNVAVNQEQNSMPQKISAVSSLLTTAESERMTLQSHYDFLTKPGVDVMPYFIDQPGVQKLRLELLDLKAQIAGRDQQLGPQHPFMLEIEKHRQELEAQLRGEIKNEVNAVRSKFDAAQLREKRLRAQLTDLESASIGLRDAGTRYETLKNDLETARKLNDSLLRQERETTVNSELAPANVRVVERARPPRNPAQPTVLLDLLLGLVAAAMFSAAAVLARAYFDSTVISSEEVEEFLQLPTLAAIPRFVHAPALLESGIFRKNTNGAANAQREIVVLQEPWSQMAEAFRTMRTAVLFSASGARTTPQVILVTSALAGEGKTVGSMNLAAALAEAGANVLLVDADLRHARCHEALGVSNERGVSTLLTNQAAPDSVIQSLKVPRLSFVAAGPRPSNPVELLESMELQGAIARWRERFTFIVIDTPPALLVSDAVVLAQQADGVVLVVKGDETPREIVRRARNRLVRAGAQVLGVVLNNVGRGWGDVYYSYDEQGPAGEARVEQSA